MPIYYVKVIKHLSEGYFKMSFKITLEHLLIEWINTEIIDSLSVSMQFYLTAYFTS